jgi:hypothetical protein
MKHKASAFKGGDELTGLKEFGEVFGSITLSQVVTFLIAVTFIVVCTVKVTKAVVQLAINRHDEKQAQKARDEEIVEALKAVKEYPKWHDQSKDIQRKFTEEIANLNNRLTKMEDDTKRRERNKTRDRLLQFYRHYGDPEKNPSGTWHRMEAETFREMCDDYIRDEGNGFIHKEVKPVMDRLTVID